MPKSCYYCKKQKPIVYYEYFREAKRKLALCWDCLDELGFLQTKNNIELYTAKCSECKNVFLKKHSWQKKCYNCYSEGKKKNG